MTLTRQQMSMVHLQASSKGPEKVTRLLLGMLFTSCELASGCMKGQSEKKGQGRNLSSKILDPEKIQAIKGMVQYCYLFHSIHFGKGKTLKHS